MADDLNKASRCSGAAGCLVVLALLLASAWTSASSSSPSDSGPVPTEPAAAYVVRPGDVLKLHVWKEPDLSVEVLVRLDGKITVPLVGEVLAWGCGPEEVATRIREKLVKFVEVPEVTVTVAQPNSARYFVLGQVGHAGSFPILAETTLLQALALAGGFATFAKRDKIIIIHDPSVGGQTGRIDYDELISGHLEQNVVLQPGDTVVVP